jgi:hypothetical protein
VTAIWSASLHLRARRTRSVGRLIRRLARSPRPAPVDRSLERPAQHENDQHERNADHDDLPLRNRASRAHARGHPDAGRRGESVHMMAFLASDNNARPEKPDARHDALDHAALLGAGRRVDRQNGQGRAEAHEAERAHAGRLTVQIAVEPEQDANQGRRAEPNRDRDRSMTGKNRIMIYGPKDNGTYVVEFRTAAGETLAISIPRTETAVIRHFQERIVRAGYRRKLNDRLATRPARLGLARRHPANTYIAVP